MGRMRNHEVKLFASNNERWGPLLAFLGCITIAFENFTAPRLKLRRQHTSNRIVTGIFGRSRIQLEKAYWLDLRINVFTQGNLNSIRAILWAFACPEKA